MFSLEEQFGVNINMDIIRGVVIFTGEEVNVFRAVSNVKDMIMSYISKQRYTPISLTHVRWQLKVSKYNFSDYHPDNARIIERAFIDKRPEVYIQTQNKDVFKIVFDEWKEYCLTDKHKQPSTIRRLDLSQGEVICFLVFYWKFVLVCLLFAICVHIQCFLWQFILEHLLEFFNSGYRLCFL